MNEFRIPEGFCIQRSSHAYTRAKLFPTTNESEKWRDLTPNEIKKERVVIALCTFISIITVIGVIIGIYLCVKTHIFFSAVQKNLDLLPIPTVLGTAVIVFTIACGRRACNKNDRFRCKIFNTKDDGIDCDRRHEDLKFILLNGDFEVIYQEFYDSKKQEFLRLDELVQKGYLTVEIAKKISGNLRLYHQNRSLMLKYNNQTSKDIWTENKIYPEAYAEADFEIQKIENEWKECQNKIKIQYLEIELENVNQQAVRLKSLGKPEFLKPSKRAREFELLTKSQQKYFFYRKILYVAIVALLAIAIITMTLLAALAHLSLAATINLYGAAIPLFLITIGGVFIVFSNLAYSRKTIHGKAPDYSQSHIRDNAISELTERDLKSWCKRQFKGGLEALVHHGFMTRDQGRTLFEFIEFYGQLEKYKNLENQDSPNKQAINELMEDLKIQWESVQRKIKSKLLPNSVKNDNILIEEVKRSPEQTQWKLCFTLDVLKVIQKYLTRKDMENLSYTCRDAKKQVVSAIKYSAQIDFGMDQHEDSKKFFKEIYGDIPELAKQDLVPKEYILAQGIVNALDMNKHEQVSIFFKKADNQELLAKYLGFVRNKSGETALMIAIKNGRADCVSLFLEKNVEVNVKSYDQSTPLHYAVVANNSNFVKQLIDKKADKYAKDKNRAMPIGKLKDPNNKEMIKLFE